MNKYSALIALLVLMAVGGFTLFFVNEGKLSQKEALLLERQAEAEAAQQRMATVETRLREEAAESDRLAREASEARLMAEAAAAKERAQREKLVNELNQRLAREAEERREAEEAQQQLAEQITALQTAQKEAQATLKALEKERMAAATSTEEQPEPEESIVLRQKLEAQDNQLAALEQENQSLKQRARMLEQKQIETEEAIISAGGQIEIPYPEIRSPNSRRREAIYFKQRVMGKP